MDEDGFQLVSRKRGFKSAKAKGYGQNKYLHITTRNIALADSSDIKEKLEKHMNEITSSEFWSKMLEKVSLIPSAMKENTSDQESGIPIGAKPDLSFQENDLCLVCYGIGEFAESLISSYQMALLMALRNTFQVSNSQCWVYDPVLCETEKEIIQSLHMDVIRKNEEGKREVEKKTLFFMPHCGKPLYNNLLWKNWSPNKLSKLYILGNSFSNIIERTPRRILEKEAQYILKIEAYMEECKIPNVFEQKDIFNDMAFIKFPHEKLVTAPAELWTDNKEPVYCEDQVEIIINKG